MTICPGSATPMRRAVRVLASPAEGGGDDQPHCASPVPDKIDAQKRQPSPQRAGRAWRHRAQAGTKAQRHQMGAVAQQRKPGPARRRGGGGDGLVRSCVAVAFEPVGPVIDAGLDLGKAVAARQPSRRRSAWAAGRCGRPAPAPAASAAPAARPEMVDSRATPSPSSVMLATMLVSLARSWPSATTTVRFAVGQKRPVVELRHGAVGDQPVLAQSRPGAWACRRWPGSPAWRKSARPSVPIRRATAVSGRLTEVRMAMSMPSRAMSTSRSLTSSASRSWGWRCTRPPAGLGGSWYWAMTELTATRDQATGLARLAREFALQLVQRYRTGAGSSPEKSRPPA